MSVAILSPGTGAGPVFHDQQEVVEIDRAVVLGRDVRDPRLPQHLAVVVEVPISAGRASGRSLAPSAGCRAGCPLVDDVLAGDDVLSSASISTRISDSSEKPLMALSFTSLPTRIWLFELCLTKPLKRNQLALGL